MNIVVLDGFTANPGDLSWEPMRALGNLTVYERSRPEEVLPRIRDAEIVLTNKVALGKEIIAAAPKLRLICEMATGYNNIDIAAARAAGIPVCNVPAYSGTSVAQLVFSYLLEIAQRVAAHSQAVHEGRWSSAPDFCFRDYPTFELAGKTLGIIGYGDIGKRVGRIAASFGMSVLAHRRSARPEEATPGIRIATLEDLLRGSDVISLHCPLNPESEGLINRDTIARMKQGAILINTARGACVVEADVREALERGALSFYAADVLSSEPPAQDNPLLGAPNAILTPHLAWMSIEARGRLLRTLAENIRAFQNGRPQHVVN